MHWSQPCSCRAHPPILPPTKPPTESKCRAESPPSPDWSATSTRTPSDSSPDLNAQLLSATRSDHDWEAIPRRRDLVRFLDLIAELERRFPGRIELGASKDGRRAVERLVDSLGFEVAQDRRRGVVMVPKNEGDDDQAFRRLAAQALGFELDSMSDRLDAGESWTVTIPRDRVPSPLPPELWLRGTGAPMGPGALATLAQDQRLSLVVAGFDRLSRETRERLGRMDLRWVHDRAPFSFRRYASAFTVENGRLVVPGGDVALPAWRDLVGAPDDTPEGLVRHLLEADHGKGAYLWHALRFAPPEAVDYFVGRGDAARGGLLRRWFDRLDESAGAFDNSQSTQSGFETLVRSLPIDGDPPRPHLPGGPGLWWAAIEEEQPPATLEDVQAAARSRAGEGVDERELFLRALTNQVDRLGPDRSALPRLLRGVNLFWQHPAIYSPENVVLVTRGSDTFAPALSVLDTMDLRSPEVARDYLLTVARLRRLGSDWPQEQLVIAFQGGVEWLRSMASAGRMDRALLERELAAWSAIHSRHDTAAAAGPDELAWTVRLLRALPPTSDDAPGRGPLERATLQALVASTEPQLQLMGLDYDSDRPRRLAAGMAETLDFFEVPAADRLAGLHDALTELARHCRAEDLDGAKRAAAAHSVRDRASAQAGEIVGELRYRRRARHRQPEARRRLGTGRRGARAGQGQRTRGPRAAHRGSDALARGRSETVSRCVRLRGAAGGGARVAAPGPRAGAQAPTGLRQPRAGPRLGARHSAARRRQPSRRLGLRPPRNRRPRGLELHALDHTAAHRSRSRRATRADLVSPL